MVMERVIEDSEDNVFGLDHEDVAQLSKDNRRDSAIEEMRSVVMPLRKSLHANLW
jgi:hypothetical protein